MFYALDVAGVRNYLLVPGLPIGLQRSGKNYPTSPLMYLLVGSRLRDSLLVLWWIIFNWTLGLLQIWKTDVGDPRSPLPSLVMNAWLGDLAPPPSDASWRKATQGALANPCSGGNSESRYLPGYRTPYRYVNSAAFNTAGRFPSNVTVPSSQFSWQEGGGRVVQRCCVSYITGASNWYWLTVGQGLLSL